MQGYKEVVQEGGALIRTCKVKNHLETQKPLTSHSPKLNSNRRHKNDTYTLSDTHTRAVTVMKAKLSSAVVYEQWQYPPEWLLLIDREDGNADPEKGMHKHDPITYTTGVKPP